VAKTNSPTFIAFKTHALVGAAATVTVQAPASGGKRTQFLYATIHTTAAAVVTLRRDGTAASTTALTPFAANSSAAAKNGAYHTSNAGTGTTVEVRSIAADATEKWNLTPHYWDGNGTTKNLTLASDAITATLDVTIVWTEEEPSA